MRASERESESVCVCVRERERVREMLMYACLSLTCGSLETFWLPVNAIVGYAPGKQGGMTYGKVLF